MICRGSLQILSRPYKYGDDVPYIVQRENAYGFLYKTAPRNKFSRNKAERPHCKGHVFIINNIVSVLDFFLPFLEIFFTVCDEENHDVLG
jgi:hypothetical protein